MVFSYSAEALLLKGAKPKKMIEEKIEEKIEDDIDKYSDLITPKKGVQSVDQGKGDGNLTASSVSSFEEGEGEINEMGLMSEEEEEDVLTGPRQSIFTRETIETTASSDEGNEVSREKKVVVCEKEREESWEQEDDYENVDDEEEARDIFVKSSRNATSAETDITMMRSALAGKVWMASYGRAKGVWDDIIANLNKKSSKIMAVCFFHKLILISIFLNLFFFRNPQFEDATSS